MADTLRVEHSKPDADYLRDYCSRTSGVTRYFFRGGGGSTKSAEDRGQREQGSGGGSPLVSGSGGSCNLVQYKKYHFI